MRRLCAIVRSAPLQLVRRSPLQALKMTNPSRRAFRASPIRESQVASDASKPLDPPTAKSTASASGAAKPAATPSNVILRHSIPSYRFIHYTVLGQLAVAWAVGPVILADEQFILNPVAPWLAFGLPVWATSQWMLWRWFARHWIVEVRALPGPSYEFDTISRAFARTKTRSILPADLFSRERVTAHTSILRLKDKKYYLINRRAEKLTAYNYDAVEEMLDPLRDQLDIEAAANAPAVEAEKRNELEAQRLALAQQYRPFKRDPKPEPANSDASPKPPQI